MNKTNTIYFGVITALFVVISFFTGATVEQMSHVDERRMLLDSIDIQDAIVDSYEHNANYHAMFNYKSKEVSANCNKCGPKLTAVQNELDSIERWKGKLVIPKVIRYRNDRIVRSQ